MSETHNTHQQTASNTHEHDTDARSAFTRGWHASAVAQTATFVVADVFIVWIATILAYFARFEGAIPADFLRIIFPVAAIASVLFPVLFLVFGLYGFIWRYVGVSALVRLGWVTALGFAIMFGTDVLVARPPLYRPIPLGTLIILGVMSFTGFFGIRIFSRLMSYVQSSQAGRTARRVLIVGAGNAAALLVRDIDNNPGIGARIVGFSDDDPGKWGRSLGRARVLGSIEHLAQQAESVQADEVWIAIPNADADEMRRILYLSGKLRLPVKIVPSMAGKGGQTLQVNDLEQVELDHFLHRDPVVTDLSAVFDSIAGRRVLVTGAAGSIGAELCRQISALDPAALIMVEIDESRLYETFLEVREAAPQATVMALCDIRDRAKMRRVFERERPDVVIHAAAYKHVPLMEMEPDEAVRSNIQGTMHVLDCCLEYGAKEFTLISTDKAVAPASVMGATKRAAELLSLAAAGKGLKVTIVRFGNVLGSRGSVVPIFEGALRRGEALRITDPEVTRYFMTIPEAVQLVLQARVLTDSCDLFVLDMGEPVRVMDLAQSLISIRGGAANVEFSGLRPAEKMHEVLCTDEEELIATSCPKVRRTGVLPIVPDRFVERCDAVVVSARGADPMVVRRLLADLLPDYHSSVDDD